LDNPQPSSLKKMNLKILLFLLMNLLDEQLQNIPIIGNLGKLSESDINRICEKIETKILNKQDCWIWTGTISDKVKKGHQHGSFWFNKNPVQIHRIMFHNFISDVPIYKKDGLIVLHKC
jgi:hypothetical protein